MTLRNSRLSNTGRAIMRLPRFHIRDILWLTTVVGLSVALWIEHRRFAAAQAWQTRAGALEALFVDKGYEVEWNRAGSYNVESESVNIRKGDQILGTARTDVFQPKLP